MLWIIETMPWIILETITLLKGKENLNYKLKLNPILENLLNSLCYLLSFCPQIQNSHQNFQYWPRRYMKVKVTQSCLTLCNPKDYSPWNSLGQNTGVGSLSLLQGIFPTQISKPGLPYCRRIPYQLNQKGSPRILGWVTYPFSSGSSQHGNWTRVSCIMGRFFTNWAIKEALKKVYRIS